MNKLLKLLVAGTVCGMGFVGCGLLEPTESTTPTITIDAIPAINAGTYKNVTGEVKAGDPITSISYKIEDASGKAVTGIKVSGPSSSSEKTLKFKDNSTIKIEVESSVAKGTYTLVITAKAGDVTGTGEFDFQVANDGPTGTPVTTKTLEAGANGNATLGSSIDLDGGSVWLSAEAANNVSKIDICYSHTASAGDKVGNAAWAKASDYNYAKNWTNPPETQMHKVTADFDAVTTAEAIDALWKDADKTANLTVVEGDVFIVKTTENKLVLVKVTAQTAGNTGKITIKYAK